MRKTILLAFLFSLLVIIPLAYFFYLKPGSPFNIGKDSGGGLQETSFGYRISQPGTIDNYSAFLVFRSTGKVRSDTIKSGTTGEKIADIVILEGYVKNSKGNSTKLNLVVKAVLPGSEENIFSPMVEDIIKTKGVQTSVKNGDFSLEDLSRVFLKDSLWRLEVILKLQDSSDPGFDPNIPYYVLMKQLEEGEYFDRISTFIASGLEKNIADALFPDALFAVEPEQ